MNTYGSVCPGKGRVRNTYGLVCPGKGRFRDNFRVPIASQVVEYIGRAYCDVMFRRVMFGRIVRKIFLPTFPVHVELMLAVSIPNPIKTHIHCF